MPIPLARDVTAWKGAARRPDCNLRLAAAMNVGNKLEHLPRIPGLRRLLKMMHGPTSLVELSSLQRFLESGCDTFASVRADGEGTRHFLKTIQLRESRLIEQPSAIDRVACKVEIRATLRKSRWNLF